MTTKKNKAIRNRSPAKKEVQLQKIIQKGLSLFIEEGESMSMRKLAQQMDIVVSGIYRYVNNKRELWFACKNKVFDKLADKWNALEEEHKGNDLELIGKIGESFLNLSTSNFPLFRFMFLQNPPKSKSGKPGPYELEQNQSGFNNLFNVVSRATESEILSITNPLYFSLALWGFVFGPAIITSPIHIHLMEGFQSDSFNVKEYHRFILHLIRKILYDS